MKNVPIKMIEANGLKLAYLEQGKGPLVILLHGFPDTAYGFVPMMGKLADAGYRTVAPFLRGYTPSSQASDNDYSVLALAKDVLAFIEQLTSKDEQAIIIGHDWGGFAAYAAANIAPQKIRCLIQMSVPHMAVTHLSWAQIRKSWYVWFFQLPFLPERQIPKNDFAFIEHLYATWSPTWQYTSADIAPIKQCLAQDGVVDVVLRYYRMMVRSMSFQQIRLLKQITSVPTLIIAGELDGAIAIDQFNHMEKAYSDFFRLITYSRIGHFPHRENTEQLTADCLEFIKQCS